MCTHWNERCQPNLRHDIHFLPMVGSHFRVIHVISIHHNCSVKWWHLNKCVLISLIPNIALHKCDETELTTVFMEMTAVEIPRLGCNVAEIWGEVTTTFIWLIADEDDQSIGGLLKCPLLFTQMKIIARPWSIIYKTTCSCISIFVLPDNIWCLSLTSTELLFPICLVSASTGVERKGNFSRFQSHCKRNFISDASITLPPEKTLI